MLVAAAGRIARACVDVQVTKLYKCIKPESPNVWHRLLKRDRGDQHLDLRLTRPSRADTRRMLTLSTNREYVPTTRGRHPRIVHRTPARLTNYARYHDMSRSKGGKVLTCTAVHPTHANRSKGPWRSTNHSRGGPGDIQRIEVR